MRCFPQALIFRIDVASIIAVVLCLLVPIAARAQGSWNSRVQISPPLFEQSPRETEAASDHSSTAQNRNANVNAADIEMGIEAIVQAEIPPMMEQATFAPIAFTSSLGAPLEERAPHAASVTVGELAVPGKAHKALQKASQAFGKGRLEEARGEIARALSIWPQYSDALVLASFVYLHNKEHARALAAAEQAIAVDRTNGMAYVVLASTHNCAAQYDDALQAIESALRFRPDAWQSYFERARAEIGKGNFGFALMDANRAAELAPNKTSVIHLLKGAALLNLSKRSDAVRELQTYLRTNPAGESAERARLMIERSISRP
ncbi:MAG TPA: tetratricopeptide repeat protein [Terriglobales bacterium]|nr:tetratricopeptide repeat protein [Terriglobales bacterium]